MAEDGRRSRLKYKEAELKRSRQFGELQDEISALKREVDNLRRGQSPLASRRFPRMLTNPYLSSCVHLPVLSHLSRIGSPTCADPAAHSPISVGAEPHRLSHCPSLQAQQAAVPKDEGDECVFLAFLLSCCVLADSS